MVTTIQNGKKALTDSIANLQVPADLTGDLSSQKWKDSQLNSSKQNVVSQVAAMNAATAQMVIMQMSLFRFNQKCCQQKFCNKTQVNIPRFSCQEWEKKLITMLSGQH